MKSIIPQRYVGLLGFGLMFMWGSAVIPWANLSKTSDAALQIVAFIGAALVSLSGVAIFLYIDELESEVKRLKERNEMNESEVIRWKEKAQSAINLVEGH